MSLRHDTREGAVSDALKSGDLLILSFEILTDDEKALPFGATDLSTRVICPRGLFGVAVCFFTSPEEGWFFCLQHACRSFCRNGDNLEKETKP